ncbi:GNAT family N-acetyltransferase [Halegenticoccus tardaugens]|uniref:GNAT family N-acetyltransferase n=1 Tax=Halegenticoccus tardaugens TaxID=2071624 RepID=UPI00100B8770|nr:GNAT family N-acetyltransferase [Halegenticoccus tardaugens]
MLPLWRLTRNRYGRALYESLRELGVTGTRMYEYVTDLDDGDVARPAPESGVELRVCDPDDSGPNDPDDLDARPAAFDERRPDELVVVARSGGETAGYLLLSADGSLYVRPLETDLTFDGAYVRRLFVDPVHRNRGIATALVATALATARDEFGAGRATALVAADNRPSQWVFEANGFRRERIHAYYRLFGLARRTTAPVRR